MQVFGRIPLLEVVFKIFFQLYKRLIHIPTQGMLFNYARCYCQKKKIVVNLFSYELLICCNINSFLLSLTTYIKLFNSLVMSKPYFI